MLAGASSRTAARSASRSLMRRPNVARYPGATSTAIAPFHSSPPSCDADDGGPKAAQRKVKKKEKKSSKKKGGDSERSRLVELLIQARDAKPVGPPPADEEEMARRFQVGREYNVGMMRRHNHINHDLNCKIRMKQHAVKMLPKESMWKKEALKLNDSGPPLSRECFLPDYPPIEDFNIDDWFNDEED